VIETGDQGRTWLLTGASGSYALHLTGGDEPLHLHWGPRISLAAAEALAAAPEPPFRGFESQLDGREEYPVEGGPRFVRPALSVRIPEVRGTERAFAGAAVDGDELRIAFADSVQRLALTLHYPDAGRLRCRRALGHRHPHRS
jgi:alpha-galactosidase